MNRSNITKLIALAALTAALCAIVALRAAASPMLPDRRAQTRRDCANMERATLTELYAPLAPAEATPPEEQTAAEYTEDDFYCLAAAIYQEAGPDYIFDDCRFRVGDVILNRVRVAVEQTAAEYTEDDLYCLAAAIYQEAGSDYICDDCRFRVGDVILNRVADPRFPDTIRDVLEAPGQYGLFAVTGVCFPAEAYTEEEAAAVERAYETAEALLTDAHHSELYGAGYVWQAEFKQGTDIIYCDNTYFGR